MGSLLPLTVHQAMLSVIEGHKDCADAFRKSTDLGHLLRAASNEVGRRVAEFQRRQIRLERALNLSSGDLLRWKPAPDADRYIYFVYRFVDVVTFNVGKRQDLGLRLYGQRKRSRRLAACRQLPLNVFVTGQVQHNGAWWPIGKAPAERGASA